MEIEEGVIRRGRRPRRITPSEIHSLIVKSPFQCGARKHHGGCQFLEKPNYDFVMVGG